MVSYRVISSDSHIVEPPDVWEGRVEPKFSDRAPHVVRQEDGDWWYCDGEKLVGQGNGTHVGRRFDEEERLAPRKNFLEDVRPGGYIPEEHVKDMDADGIYAGVLYPSVGLALYRWVRDSHLLTALFRAYNDWLAEFCKPFPDRLKGIAMLNAEEVPSGVKELERCANMGLAGAMITVFPFPGQEYISSDYEPLWAAAQDLEMPLSLHFGTNRPAAGQEIATTESLNLAFFCNADYWVRMSLFHMIFSGVFERYPRLRVGAVETELAWVLHFLTQMDYSYTQRPLKEDSFRSKEGLLPSDYFHRNVFLSFQEDALGIRLRDIIGVDNLQWGSDYPHFESTFPRSREILEEILADCTEEQKAKIAGGNAARIYHLD